MMEIKLMVQTPGLVLFDPVVLQKFIVSKQVPLPNVLETFINDLVLGNEAIRAGCLLPIYSIPAWDYRIYITMADKPTVPAEWVLFTTPTFVLQISSEQLVVSDIWAIMQWDINAYSNTNSHVIDSKYAAANEFQVSSMTKITNGRYQVNVVGFCDIQNPDIENRSCGYEFLVVHDEQAVFSIIGSIDNMDLDVVRLP